MKAYVVTVRRVLEEVMTIEVEAETPAQAREVAIKDATSERTACWNYRPVVHGKALKIQRVR